MINQIEKGICDFRKPLEVAAGKFCRARKFSCKFNELSRFESGVIVFGGSLFSFQYRTLAQSEVF